LNILPASSKSALADWVKDVGTAKRKMERIRNEDRLVACAELRIAKRDGVRFRAGDFELRKDVENLHCKYSVIVSSRARAPAQAHLS